MMGDFWREALTKAAGIRQSMNRNRQRRKRKQAKLKLLRKQERLAKLPIFLNMDSDEWKNTPFNPDRPVMGYRMPRGTTLEEELKIVVRWKETYNAAFNRPAQSPKPKKEKKWKKPQPQKKAKKNKKFKKLKVSGVKIELVGTELN